MDRGKVLWEEDLERLNGQWARYKDVDGDGITYRTVPGNRHPRAGWFARGTGHDENARYTEDSTIWHDLLERLKRKFETARQYVPAPAVENTPGARIGVIAFGSSEPAIQEARHQFYDDGAYLQLSHNYHRVALQVYLWALALRRGEGKEAPAAWIRALDRSLDFLLAHQNPRDGRLPNYGTNDGALPSVLTSCDYSDFRPTLQAVSLAVRGRRLYDPGPWDEEAAWMVGPAALASTTRLPKLASASFAETGFHVLRGRDPVTFACFRCGTVRDRFSQIDMLHVDVFWRGENVLVDAGSYLYNGPPDWHRHFTGGESHNVVTVDGHDQMVHHRQFKLLHRTKARLLRFEDTPAMAWAEGEHYGFRRYRGRCVHRRAVIHAKDDLWVVVDCVEGSGLHSARLHWLAAPYSFGYEVADGRMTLDTPCGTFTVTVMDGTGHCLGGDVVSGGERPPRGWLSRYYGEKTATPSLAVVQTGDAPLVFVSILAAGRPVVAVDGDEWSVQAMRSIVRCRIRAGRVERAEVL
jgi:asparagine synthase (glutamine-hydrolysing)